MFELLPRVRWHIINFADNTEFVVSATHATWDRPMRLWLIPMTYVAASAVCGIVWPRIWRHFLSSYVVDVSVASAQAVLAAVASGMMALTGLVFALAFVMVQFSAIAYSPRLVNWLARDPRQWPEAAPLQSMNICSIWTGRLNVRNWILGTNGRPPRRINRGSAFPATGRMLSAKQSLPRSGRLLNDSVGQVSGDFVGWFQRIASSVGRLARRRK
jgi:hypothetical protein